ncbi:MAG: AMP-binding protein [Caulobacteraceae bacterium]
MTWVYADCWESIAAAQPDEPALIQGAEVVQWGRFDVEADALAYDLLAAGMAQQSKVGILLYNAPEFLVSVYAAFKAGLAPFNINYRYGPEELHYLLDNADAEAVVFHAEFAPRLEAIRSRLPLVKRWIAVEQPGHPAPDWAERYAEVSSRRGGPRGVRASWGRSEDDLLLVYTGGTTGMPKGVMWRQGDLFGVGNYGANPVLGLPPLDSPETAGERARMTGRPLSFIASPLMHATGLISGCGALNAGGAAAFLPSRKFDAAELWNEVERLRVARISIVGMAFAVPMLEALDANPGRWDLSCVRVLGSSGSMWSRENKQGLLRHLPQATLADSFSSSEAFGMGLSQSTANGEEQTARFVVGANCAVFTEDGRRVEPGSGERGMTAVGGFIPAGYYKDPEKTAKTFRMFEGRRWSTPGDWATVNDDGTLNLLGRGSQCINTGGEKVFPEEVEEALKRHPAVRDAAVVGLPDPRFGERICALVELKLGADDPGGVALASHVKAQLADYKAPRDLLIVETVGRAPNGKLDYKAVKATAESWAAARSAGAGAAA